MGAIRHLVVARAISLRDSELGAQHGPENVEASSGQGQDRLSVVVGWWLTRNTAVQRAVDTIAEDAWTRCAIPARCIPRITGGPYGRV